MNDSYLAGLIAGLNKSGSNIEKQGYGGLLAGAKTLLPAAKSLALRSAPKAKAKLLGTSRLSKVPNTITLNPGTGYTIGSFAPKAQQAAQAATQAAAKSPEKAKGSLLRSLLSGFGMGAGFAAVPHVFSPPHDPEQFYYGGSGTAGRYGKTLKRASVDKDKVKELLNGLDKSAVVPIIVGGGALAAKGLAAKGVAAGVGSAAAKAGLGGKIFGLAKSIAPWMVGHHYGGKGIESLHKRLALDRAHRTALGL